MEEALDIVPGLSVGSFVLGMPVGDAINVIQREVKLPSRPSVIESRSTAEMRIRVPSANVTLHFDNVSQTLTKIKMQEPWPCFPVFLVSSGGHLLAKGRRPEGGVAAVQRRRRRRLCLFSQSQPLSFSTLQKLQIGVRRVRVIDSQTRCESNYVGISFRFHVAGPDRHLRSLVVFSGSDDIDVPVPAPLSLYCPDGLYVARKVMSLLCRGDPRKIQVVGLKLELSYLTQDKVTDGKAEEGDLVKERAFEAVINFGDSMQDVVTELGYPEKTFIQEKPSRLMKRQSNCGGGGVHPVEMHFQPPSGDLYLNFLSLGMDVVISKKSLSVERFVLHSNWPNHQDFGMYRRCPFHFEVRCCCRHVVTPTRHRFVSVTPTTKWTDVQSHVVCGDARCISTLRRQPATNNPSPFPNSYCCIFDQLAFEVLTDGSIAGVFVLPCSPFIDCFSGKGDPHRDVFYASLMGSRGHDSTLPAAVVSHASGMKLQHRPWAKSFAKKSASSEKQTSDPTEKIKEVKAVQLEKEVDLMTSQQYVQTFAPTSELARSPPRLLHEKTAAANSLHSVRSTGEESSKCDAVVMVKTAGESRSNQVHEQVDIKKNSDTNRKSDFTQSPALVVDLVSTTTTTATATAERVPELRCSQSTPPLPPVSLSSGLPPTEASRSVSSDESHSSSQYYSADDDSDDGESTRHAWSLPKQPDFGQCSLSSLLSISESGKADYVCWEDISSAHHDVYSQLEERCKVLSMACRLWKQGCPSKAVQLLCHSQHLRESGDGGGVRQLPFVNRDPAAAIGLLEMWAQADGGWNVPVATVVLEAIEPLFFNLPRGEEQQRYLTKLCVVVGKILERCAERVVKSRPGRSLEDREKHQENIACRRALHKIRKSVSAVLVRMNESSAVLAKDGAAAISSFKKALQVLDGKFLFHRLQ